MRIGIVCYASVGGSGVVATELARALAARGHDLHLLSTDRPFRWRDDEPRLTFHRVDTPAYPLFREPQYLLVLSTKIAEIACDQKLDVIHAHYAVPHATAAYLADRMLRADAGACRPATVTTLHGTDITLVGTDPSYRRVVAFSIEQSRSVTAVSESLKRDTITGLGLTREIQVIPNFLDCSQYQRQPNPDLRRDLSPAGEAIVMHTSNFRPVKRVDVVFEIFKRLRSVVPARLVMIGDGPDRAPLEDAVRHAGLAREVIFPGEQHDLVSWLSTSDLFLLPSSQESFGMAALEAMACGVPVIASRVGGLPEIIESGETGFLCDPDDMDGMAHCAAAVLRDRPLALRIGQTAAASVRARFCAERVVPMYEQLYEATIAASRPDGYVSTRTTRNPM